jgi:hypothetical protein
MKNDADSGPSVLMGLLSGIRRWVRRPTVRTLRRQYEAVWSASHQLDVRENDDSRLSEGEGIQLAAVTLVEAFTPSTVAELYAALERWERRTKATSTRKPGELIAQLENSRSVSQYGGWASLGHLRRTQTHWPMAQVDETLPIEVQSVDLGVSFVTASVAIVTATFVFVDGAGDLTPILRSDRTGRMIDVRVRALGRLGKVRGRLPFARPAAPHVSSSWDCPVEQKQREIAALTGSLEASCVAWLRGQFPGRFAALSIDRHPLVRILLTEKKVPFTAPGSGRTAEDIAGIGSKQAVFRSNDGWTISTGNWPSPVRRNCWLMANRRTEAAAARRDSDTSGSNAAVVGWATGFQHDLPAALGLWALLDLLERELADVRDLRRGRRIGGPVRNARELNNYLLRGGLDTVTVTADIAKAATGRWFLWHAPTFLEDDHQAKNPPSGQPVDFIAGIRRRLVSQATALRADAINTSDNLRGSAELQQAIANTRMQRAVIALTVLAIAIAVASFIVAI